MSRSFVLSLAALGAGALAVVVWGIQWKVGAASVERPPLANDAIAPASAARAAAPADIWPERAGASPAPRDRGAEIAAATSQVGRATGADIAVAARLLDWVRTDAHSCLRYLATLDGAEATMLAETLGDVAVGDLAAAGGVLPWLGAVPPSLRTPIFGAAARGWARRDPPAAARWLGAEGDDGLPAHVWAGVAGEWAVRDPSAALAWAQALPAVQARVSSTQAILQSWYARDPLAAVDAIEALGQRADLDPREWADVAEAVFGLVEVEMASAPKGPNEAPPAAAHPTVRSLSFPP